MYTPAAAPFVRFGPSHWAVIVSTALISALLVLGTRIFSSYKVRSATCYGLAGVLFGNEMLSLGIRLVVGQRFFQQALPLQFCDFAGFAAILALCRRWQIAYELAYFWGLGGGMEAIVTPDLAFDFPNIGFITFFVGHGGTIVAALFLTLGLKMRPWPRSILRAIAAGQVYIALAAIVDCLANANYGYLRAKPGHSSLVDYFGPWPFYIVGFEIVGALSFLICYLPFFIGDRVHAAQNYD